MKTKQKEAETKSNNKIIKINKVSEIIVLKNKRWVLISATHEMNKKIIQKKIVVQVWN